jgi:uncharacterized protein YmfQ (DUF2313 family)
MSIWRVTSKSGDTDSAKIAERLLNDNDPAFQERARKALLEEWERQLGLGLPPSEGMPDVRRTFAVYHKK